MLLGFSVLGLASSARVLAEPEGAEAQEERIILLHWVILALLQLTLEMEKHLE